jgi:hypothetical protein
VSPGSIAFGAKRVGTPILLLLISYALGEIVLRLVDRVRPSFVFRDDSYNRFRVKPLDTHWNIAGNRLVAGRIVAFLLDTNLVPAPGARSLLGD